MTTPQPQEHAVDPALLDIIVCPNCRSELELTSQPEWKRRSELELTSQPESKRRAGQPTDGELVCGGCGLRYPIRDGIPVLLVDEALPPR